MQVEYQLKIGKDLFTLKADVEDEKDFFEKMSFYSNLPRTGPNGEEDLKLVYRTTQEGHKYYSLVSTKADQEFKFGQNKDTSKGVLFPKGWEPLYKPNAVTNTPGIQGNVAPAIGIQQQTAPVQTQAAPIAAPVQAIQPQIVPQSAPVTPTQVAQPVPTPPVQSAPVQAADPAAVKTVANDVLARFGIKTNPQGATNG
jgi:hypothetical protein